MLFLFMFLLNNLVDINFIIKQDSSASSDARPSAAGVLLTTLFTFYPFKLPIYWGKFQSNIKI